MKLKDSSNIKSLFSMPAFELHSSKLFEAFKRNLTTVISKDDAPESSSQEEEPMEVDNDQDNDAVVPNEPEQCKFFVDL